jgi:thiamine transport system permease protein
MIHAVISFPFAFQSVSAAARQLTPGIVAAGRSLGGSRFDVFRRITVPILLPGILTGFSFSAAISLGEIQAAMMLLGGRATIPITLYRLIGSYNFHAACALGTILIVLCAVSFFLVIRFETGERRKPWVS